MKQLYGLTHAELLELVAKIGSPSYTADQLARWLYHKPHPAIEEMSNISKRLREQLSAEFEIGRSTAREQLRSYDGTTKYLFESETDGAVFESVVIPDEDRNTLCISSQSGCKHGCRFCMTARLGKGRNLSVAEILSQYQSLPNYEEITNIVYMGMGEPLDNLENLLNSLEILTSICKLSSRRITVSTIGILPALEEFLNRTKVRLAFSLHSPFPDERASFLPAERKYPMLDTLQLLRERREDRRRRITIEYIPFAGLNDSREHAHALARLLRGMELRVNIIPWNTIPGSRLEPTDPHKLKRFQTELESCGLPCTLRASRGPDIAAACGMLAGEGAQHPKEATDGTTG